MRSKFLGSLFFCLAIVCSAAAFVPKAAADPIEGIFLITGIFDCCRGTTCFENGCWVTHDCTHDDDCQLLVEFFLVTS